MGVQYDLLHATLEGVNSWPLGFKLIQPYIGTMDMKDFYWKKIGEGWGEELTPLGEGMIDFKKFMRAVKRK